MPTSAEVCVSKDDASRGKRKCDASVHLYRMAAELPLPDRELTNLPDKKGHSHSLWWALTFFDQEAEGGEVGESPGNVARAVLRALFPLLSKLKPSRESD
mmetsp:Transcript_60487/g.128224  ORF Transcript_60487/g.128224 Transcript_60487/m.128224 type:complete len:100 (+) Transcript_60487:35-334(+)